MTSPAERVWARTDLSPEDRAWLTRLQADWQIIADLSFADLVLWVPDAEHQGFWALAQMRPTTGPTALMDDVVGAYVPMADEPMVQEAFESGRIVREGDPEWRDKVPVRIEAIPVRRHDRVLAVVTRNTNLHGVRTPSRLELAYLEAASDLAGMIADGRFPHPGERSDHADTPRVGDGFIRLDPDATVRYASPNALSLFRRLGLSGDLAGQRLPTVVRSLVSPRRRGDEETISAVLGARVARDTEIDTGQVMVIFRAIPLSRSGERAGGIVLLRDVTDLRRRDRELVTKDATIREIHHRVKNNLQTVAALLRLQARRIDSDAGRVALEEAVRRVGAIAVVHDILSQTFADEVEFDEVVDHLARLVGEVGAWREPVTITRHGSFGVIGSEIATPLAMVVTETLQNALEHGFPRGGPGRIRVDVQRTPADLVVGIIDDGVGLMPGAAAEDSDSLGLSIVRTLVGELGGTFTIGPADPQGTHARIGISLPDTRTDE